MSEPRQWTIRLCEDEYFDGTIHDIKGPHTNRVDVIEKSAYDTLVAENARLREALLEIADGYMPKVHNCQIVAREALGPGDAK
jgi:hypothetical protein